MRTRLKTPHLPAPRSVLSLALLAAILASPAASAAASGAVGVRVAAEDAPRLAALDLQPRIEIDYPCYTWLVLTRHDADTLAAHAVAHEVIVDPFALTLGEQRFDPLVEAPAIPAEWASPMNAGEDLSLVQTWGPSRESWPEELRSRGLTALQYIHPFTYVVWGPTNVSEVTENLEWVRWAAPFAPAYRVLPRWRDLPPEAIAVDMLIVREAEIEVLRTELEALGVVVEALRHISPVWTRATTTIPGDLIRDVARLGGMYSVQPQPTRGGLRSEMSDQINANNVNGGGNAYPGYQQWLDAIGLNGAGVTMANVDSGFDEAHPDLANRLAPCAGTTCGGGPSSHGTHTAGIMAADGSSGTTDSFGFLRGLGVAPAALLVEQTYSPFYLEPGGLLLLIEQSHANGATLSSNAWGPSDYPLGYDSATLEVDLGARDADPLSAANQSFTYVLSIMNGYGGVSSQGTPDEAKNILTIGSTNMRYSDGSQSSDVDSLSLNTAHGPALDGRLIPHMVAPGCRVDSTMPNANYALNCGTSMASPQVGGAIALFVQRYRAMTAGGEPSPALTKAAFLPVAHDLAGHLDADGGAMGHPFDSKQGWGRLNLEAVVEPAAPVVYLDEPFVFEASGEQWQRTMDVADPTRSVRLMLAWTDAAGHGLGGSTPAWNNDLDLLVDHSGQTFAGNSFAADGWSSPGGANDGMNNTEGVFLGPTASGELTVRVRATTVGSDGIPGVGDLTDQDFSLVVYNAIARPCEPSPFLRAPLTVTETIIEGAQGFHLEWRGAATCAGELLSRVYSSQGPVIGNGKVLVTTAESTVDVLGGLPGTEYCFHVQLVEDGVPGQSSAVQCITGSAQRAAGDADCSQEINAADLLLVVDHLFGGPEPSCAGYPSSDANLDGHTDAADLAQIIGFIADPL